MRILIYSENEVAKAARAELKAAGHHASLRNPQYFNPAQFEKCDKVLAYAPSILRAYQAAGIPAERLDAKQAIEKAKSEETEHVSADKSQEYKETDTPIPSDFPGARALDAAGITDLAQLQGVTLDDLTAIKGIGYATANAILAELAEK